MEKELIETDKAPKAIGPYSQAVTAGDFIFLSGQIPINPDTGELVTGTIEEQTQMVIQNLELVLEAAGSSIEMVVKTTVYLKAMSDFAAMNGIYESHFGGSKPARATVEVSRLPKDVKIEMDAIAIR